MEDKIDLTQEQKKKRQQIYNKMKGEAVALGEQLIRLEMGLNSEFSTGNINQELLENYVQEIEKVTTNLRIVHLPTHLQTPNILTNKQIISYNKLRGYSKGPCQDIPEGHNSKIWKKHNGCK